MRSNNTKHSPSRLYRLALNAILLLLTLGWLSAQTTSGTASSPGQAALPQAPPASSQVQSPAAPIAASKPLVIIDPAHGGTESGAVLNPAVLEKDVTLALALRLRGDLNARGIMAELVRDADVALSVDDRAAKANSEHPALYICLHATSQAGPMRIYSAMLGEGQENNGPFVDWDTAQSASLAASRSTQQQMVAALQKRGISIRALQAPLRPLNNVTTAAIGIELAPTKADVAELMSADYQENASAALANGVAAAVLPAAATSGALQ